MLTMYTSRTIITIISIGAERENQNQICNPRAPRTYVPYVVRPMPNKVNIIKKEKKNENQRAERMGKQSAPLQSF